MPTTRDPRVVAAELTHFVDRIALGVADSFRVTAQALNPVETGFSQSNWIVTAGSPYVGTIGSKADVDEGASDDSMARVRESWTLRQGDLFVTNNVDYVEGLDRRHRTAAGFVRVAVQRAAILGARSLGG